MDENKPKRKGPKHWGNNFYTYRTKSGRNKKFATPEDLWNAACEYFCYVDAHPWIKNEAIKSGENCGKILQVPTARPYTQQGLCLFINTDAVTFQNYGEGETYKEFHRVHEMICKIIYTQKFEGAAVGAFNPVIISKDLGLIEKTQMDVAVGLKEVGYGKEG